MSLVFQGRSICGGISEGEALVTRQSLSFLGGVDVETGIVTQVGHELFGYKITNKILILPALKGSSAALWIITRLAKNKMAPKGIIVPQADTILVGSVILGEIPTIDLLPVNPTERFTNGDLLKMDATKGKVRLMKKNSNPDIVS